MTQKELCEKCGIADSAIRRYELGGANPKRETLQKIADALDVPIYVLSGEFETLSVSHIGKQIRKYREELMIIIAIAGLIVTILNLKNK